MMSLSLSQQSSKTSNAMVADQNQSQQTRTLMLKEKKTPIKVSLDQIEDCRARIPRLDGCLEDVRNYYQGLLEGLEALKIVVVEGDSTVQQAESNLHEIVRGIKSLLGVLAESQLVAYQERFDKNQCDVFLGRIDRLNELLNKRCEELKSFESTLSFGRSTVHLGEEISEKRIVECFKKSEAEKASLQNYDEIAQKLVETETKIHDKELKKAESSQKVKEVQERISRLKQMLQGKEELIQELKANFLTCSETLEGLRTESNNQLASQFADIRSKSENRQERARNLLHERIEKIDEQVSNLVQKQAQHLTGNPLLHYIMVLDHSGSMQNSRWPALLTALEAFVKKNQSQTADLLSVITFDDSATEMMKKIKFSEYKTPVSSKWGGTYFEPAFAMARDISNLSRTHRPVVVFLTDGEGKMGEGESILREMHDLHKEKGFMFFSIGVGDEFNLQTLQQVTRTANNGGLFVDLGSERIEFVHTTRDEKVLVRIFDEIFNAINTLPLKARAAMDGLKRARKEAGEEMKEDFEFYADSIQQQQENISAENEGLLERKIEVIRRRMAEDQERVDFLKRETKELEAEIEILESKLKEENRSVVEAEIEALKKNKEDLEDEKQNAWGQKKKLTNDRASLFVEMEKNKSNWNFTTQIQQFNFLKAKDNVETLKVERKAYLAEMRNFLSMIERRVSGISEELRATDTNFSQMEGTGMLDFIFEHYFEHYSDMNNLILQRGEDIPNFRKIACKILEIKETKVKDVEALDLMISGLHPRDLVDPLFTKENHKAMITESLNRKYKSDIEFLDDEHKRLDDEWRSLKNSREAAKDRKKELKEEIDDEEEDKEKQEKKVRGLRRARDSGDSEYNEEELIAAEKKLNNANGKLEKLELKLARSKEVAKNLEIELKEIKSKMAEIDMEKSQKEREKRKMIDKALDYYGVLSIELLVRIKKRVIDARTRKILAFQERTAKDVVGEIQEYFAN